MGCNHCEEFSRSHLVRQAVAEAGTRPARDRAGNAGARRHRASTGARSCCARAPRCSPSTAPRSCGLGDLEAGDRPGRRRATTGSWSRSSSTAASTRSRCSRRPPTRSTSRCARPWRCRPAPEPRSPRTRSLRWNPAAASLRRPAPGGQDVGAAGSRLLEPRPVALHLAPLLGGRRPAAERGHRLDGPAARPDRHRRQPASGTLARRLAVAGAGHRARSRSRRSTGPPTTSGPRASGARPRS